MPQSIHIGIDGNEANVPNRVGSNRYAYSLLEALYQIDSTSRYTIYLKQDPLADLPQAKDNWHYRVIKPQKLWTQWRLPLDLYTHHPRPDVFFSPGHYAPRRSPVPTVITILDLAFLKYPNLFLKLERGLAQLQSWTQYSARQAAQVIAISKNTKRDIVDLYHLDANSISVAYPGIDRQLYQPQDPKTIKTVRLKYKLGKDYLLYVGTLQPRKNLSRILQAYESLPRTYKNLEWVIVGGKGWYYQDFLNLVNHSPKKDLIKRLGYVDLQDLPALYSGAKATLLVGLYEGFGLPAAESLSCATLPIVANTASLPEVVGHAGITVNPFSVTSIKRGILYTLKLSSAEKRKRLKLAESQLEQFDWPQSAQIIKRVLYDVALQRPHR